MNILNKLKWNGACLGLCLAGCLWSSRAARAEVTMLDQDGWTLTFDGRINSFASYGHGDDFPRAPMGSAYIIMGAFSQAASGVPDVGWLGAYQQDINNNYNAIRVRSGMFGNVLGFGVQRKVSDTLTVKGYVQMWSTIETLARDKWAPITAEARQGYFTAGGPWGSFTVGRTLSWLGRTGYEIDVMYGHGYGLGLPCTDALGPACGHVGTGALHPGYSAGIAYSTPNFNGLQLHLGAYDPVVFSTTPNDWSHASFVRPEGALTFDKAMGSVRLKVGVEGVVQQLGRIRTTTDAAGMSRTDDATTNLWGVSGGVRVEGGPLRVGLSGFRGKGIGLGMALQKSVASADNDSSASGPNGLTYELRTFTGYYAQVALVFGKLQLSGGYGVGLVDQLPSDKINTGLSVIHSQTGISGALYYSVSENVVIGVDVFDFMASWYGAPLMGGGKMPGEKQQLIFANAGATYHW